MLTSVEALYREGETLYESGRLEEAEAKFAVARQTLMRSEEALFFQPNVYEYFLRLSRRLPDRGRDRTRGSRMASLFRPIPKFSDS